MSREISERRVLEEEIRALESQLQATRRRLVELNAYEEASRGLRGGRVATDAWTYVTAYHAVGSQLEDVSPAAAPALAAPCQHCGQSGPLAHQSGQALCAYGGVGYKVERVVVVCNGCRRLTAVAQAEHPPQGYVNGC